MAETVDGTDYSWLAVDGEGHVGWFCLNGLGPLPDALAKAPEALVTHEKVLAEWIRSSGRAFEFGAGDSMWQEAAAAGVFAFDYIHDAHAYQLVARPRLPVRPDDLPEPLREVLIVHLEAADFATGVVTPTQVATALPRRTT